MTKLLYIITYIEPTTIKIGAWMQPVPTFSHFPLFKTLVEQEVTTAFCWRVNISLSKRVLRKKYVAMDTRLLVLTMMRPSVG